MSPPVLHLPLDLSGDAVTNRVTAELHAIAASGNRAIVTQRGPFFTKNLVVRNANTGTVLVPDVDYRPVHMFLEASLRATLEICSVVLVLPACTATAVEIDYSAIGGEYSASVSSIEQMIESLDLDNRTVYWGDLLGAPEYFPPTAHLHDIGDLYGFEYLVASLEGVRRAILMGDQAAFDELRRYIDMQDNELRNLISSGLTQIEEHLNRTDNPHNTTKAHVGLGNVQNYGVATQSQAQVGTANNVYMTPLRTHEAIAAVVGNTLNAHVARLDNPHQVTKAQVGLSDVQNYGVATVSQAMAGNGVAYMTASLVGTAITSLAINPLNAHIARTDNPHAVTKTQVGLGSVNNYGTASNAQTVTGTATNLYVTPAGDRAALEAYVPPLVNAHANRTDNPHSVTKAQVGLGSVQNYGIASNAQAIAGTATNLYMTPANTKAAIDPLISPMTAHIGRTDNPHNVTKAQVGLGNVQNIRQVGCGTSHDYTLTWGGGQVTLTVGTVELGRVHTAYSPDPNIAAHTSRTNNPHNVTAAQVGLGSVLNYGVATQAQAEAGTANNLYMTPLRTQQAITSQAVTPLTALINARVSTGSNATLNSLTLFSAAYLYNAGSGALGVRVNGNRYWTFETNGNFTASNGRVIASGGFQPSDRRFKTNVKPTKARALWRELSFVQYVDVRTQEASLGAIAQEALPVCPTWVTEFDYVLNEQGDTEKRYALDYTGIAYENAIAAGEAVDALKEEVAELKGQVAQLLALLQQKQ